MVRRIFDNKRFFEEPFSIKLESVIPKYKKFLDDEEIFLDELLERYSRDSNIKCWIWDVVEFGCGGGRLLKICNKYAHHKVGIDYSETQLNEVKKKFRKDDERVTTRSGRSFEFLQLDMSKPFLIDSYNLFDNKEFKADISFCFDNTLGNIATEKRDQVIRNMIYSLKDKGLGFIHVFSKNVLELQLEQYMLWGFDKILEKTDDYVHVGNGKGVTLTSARFSEQDLHRLMQPFPVSYNISKINEYGYLLRIKK